ncbi:MAG: RecX family transcriptional regulator [Chloroflexota bacterium]
MDVPTKPPAGKTITALKQQQKNKDRVSVFLDDAFAFGLSMDAAMHLKKGQKLTEAEIAQLKEADGYNKAFHAALRYLGYRQRSCREIERYLADKEYPGEVIEATIHRLYEYSYVDDEAFARAFVADRERFRPKGERALRQELRHKGIDDEIITSVLTELDEDASAWAAVEPKMERWLMLDEEVFKKKITGFLGRRGFSYEIIRTVIERGLIERGRNED